MLARKEREREGDIVRDIFTQRIVIKFTKPVGCGCMNQLSSYPVRRINEVM